MVLAVPVLLAMALLFLVPHGMVAVPREASMPIVEARAHAPEVPPHGERVRADVAHAEVAAARSGDDRSQAAAVQGLARFRVRLLDDSGLPLAGTRLRAWVQDRVWLGDAVCDAHGLASFPDARGLLVRIAPRGEGGGWSAELGSSTHEVVEVRVRPGSGARHVPE